MCSSPRICLIALKFARVTLLTLNLRYVRVSVSLMINLMMLYLAKADNTVS